jgi:serine/threonine protein kinase/tetratricopeptide (TPR) repeat protein
MAEPAQSLSDSRIGPYQIVGKVGAGGMGVVFKAIDVRLQRTVALKFLPTDREVLALDKERLLREARAASALDHPNIATVYAVEEAEDGRLFIVMAYYQGETLDERIRRGPLPSAEAADMARQIARGLARAHAQGIVHRDIKPSNIMITSDGVAKIVDFGLALAVTSSASTQSMGAAGTLPYMSPEQAMGKAADARTDIWALGVVLYEMLTGRLPFTSDSPAATVMAIVKEPPAEMGEVPKELQLVVFRALSKGVEARYQSCAEMLADLGASGQLEGVPAPGVGRRELQRARSATASVPAMGRARKAWIGAAVALVVILAALLLSPLRQRLLSPVPEKHIVVLPFDVSGGGPAAESLANGLMESVTGKLSNLDAGQQSVWVVPSLEVQRRKISDPGSARRDLGATIVVKGILRQQGQEIRLMLDVIDAHNLRLLGSATVNETTGSLSALEDEAVSHLAEIMHIRTARPSHPTAAGSTTVPAAYEDYLKGLGFLQRYDKPGNLDSAIALFESAVKTDPGFALALTALGEAYWDRYRLDQNPQWVEKAAAYCRRAAELNDQLPAVYITLGRIHDGTGQHNLALQEFQHALKLEPRSADALLGLAGVYESMGRVPDAEAVYKRAAALRPDYWGGYYELGVFYYRQGRYLDAANAFRRVLEITPDNAQAHSNLGAMVQNLGHETEAEAEFKKSLALHPTYAAYANLGNLYYHQNRWADSAAMTEKALQLNNKDYRLWANLGLAYDWLNDVAKANAAYEEELKRLEETAKIKADDAAIQSELGVLYSRKRLRNKALPHIEAALALAPSDGRTLADAGEAYDNLGDRNKALELVKKSLEHGWTMDQLQRNPGLRSLVADPRFRSVTAEVSSAKRP